ncbi:BnaAnng05160D [Brassica napus]|uniref:BnaAnng05160D protein n=1 Tax=Brassica napus TaxID=3708 RepID=A0A078HHK2_BRANA|nr:BnaAnng05160D [Brassica napus]
MDQINRTLQKFKIVIFFYYEIVIISKRELKKSYLSWQAKSSASLQARWELKIQSYGSHCPQESTQQDRGITLLLPRLSYFSCSSHFLLLTVYTDLHFHSLFVLFDSSTNSHRPISPSPTSRATNVSCHITNETTS